MADRKLVAENRRARRDYEIESNLETGIMLLGTEVKSLRLGKANIAESYASIEDNGLFLINADIPIYPAANRFNHEPKRKRKLLVHARELAKISQAIEREGRTAVPLKLYFNDRGMAKVELGVAKGRKNVDKRAAVKERDWNRDKQRVMREKG